VRAQDRKLRELGSSQGEVTSGRRAIPTQARLPTMPIMKYCLEHGIVEPSHACRRKPARTRRYFDAARTIRDNATTCALCGKGARDNDPWVADHIVPRAEGGSDHISNLQPAHPSCNGRRSQAMQQ
jgi:5-methylcytosine-specific restriction endonuclease McrA